MIITNAGSRTDSLTKLRMTETDRFEPIRTSRVAMPRPMAFTTVLVTARSGHSPSTCTSAGVLVQSPSLMISALVLVAISETLLRQGWHIHGMTNPGLVVAEVEQGFLHGLNDSPRCNGGPGKLVKHATVLFHVPSAGVGMVEGAAVKTVDPVGLPGLDTVAQPRGFSMAGNPDAQHLALKVNAHQQVDVAGVAIGRHSRENQAHRCAVLTCHPGDDRRGSRSPGIGGQAYHIVQQVVVVPAFGNDFEERAGLGPCRLLGNAVFGDALGERNGAPGNHGKQAEADGAPAHG